MSKKYWLHRISHHWEESYVLFEKGYLSLGWSAFSDTGILDAARHPTVEEFEKIYTEKRKDKKRSRWNMWYFAQLDVGDIVIVPLSNGEFSVCKVTEIAKPIDKIQHEIGVFVNKNKEQIAWENGLLKNESKNIFIDLGFVAEVSVIRKLKRTEYADSALTSRMKMRQTNGDISDLADNIEAIILADKPINFYENAISQGAKCLLERIQKDLDDTKFENLVKIYMKKIGADYVYIPSKNEKGKMDFADADVIAVFDTLRITIQIQAKHHKKITNEWAVEQITKYKEQIEDTNAELSHDKEDEYTNIAWVISSCDDYSDNAKKLADENNVRLINGLEFSRMLIDIGLANIDIK